MGTIFIKNMVCDRCISYVKKILDKHEISYSNVQLGEVSTVNDISLSLLPLIEIDLRAEGFELIDTSQPVLVIRMKAALVQLFNQEEIPEDFKLSTFLTNKFPYDYSHLSRLFSQYERDTLEHFLIKLRIEKAKELLSYNDKNISEIAYGLGYTSAAHFSRQFKKLVGLSPSQYKTTPTDRKSIDNL